MSATVLGADVWWLRSPVGFPAGLAALPNDWLRRAVASLMQRVSPSSEESSTAGVVAAVDRETDLRDVEATLAGDGDAYARLVRRYQGPVGGTMWRFTRDRLAWEELVQDVFVEAYSSLPSFKDRAPLLHWLRRIAIRVGYRYWRRRDRQRKLAPVSIRDWDQVLDARADGADAREAAEIVHAVLQRLAPRDRLVLTLIYLEGCSVAEAAGLAGWSQSMVKVQAYRARKRLARLLQEGQGQSRSSPATIRQEKPQSAQRKTTE